MTAAVIMLMISPPRLLQPILTVEWRLLANTLIKQELISDLNMP